MSTGTFPVAVWVGRVALLALLALPALVGCGKDATAVCAVRGVTISGSPQTMVPGASAAVRAAVDQANCGAVAITWQSSNPAVLTIASPSGPNATLVAVAPGFSQVTASANGVVGAATVQVVAPTPAAVASVTIAPPSPSAQVGDVIQFTVTLRDQNGTTLPAEGRSITWRSSNPAIGSISQTGSLTLLAPGTDTITATVSPEGKTGTAVVVVSPRPATTLAFTAQPNDAAVGTPIAPPVDVTLRDATGATATAATNVVTLALENAPPGVTLGGTVTATPTKGVARFADLVVLGGAASGLALRASATSLVGAVSSPFKVTGPSTAPVATVTVTLNPRSIPINQSSQATAVLKDAAGNVLTRPVRWSSSALGVATVDAGTGTTVVVRGVGVGTATITATSEDRSGTDVLTVERPPVTPAILRPAPNVPTVQNGTLGQPVPVPPAVLVLADDNSTPVPGVDVSFSVATGGGTIAPAAGTSRTGADGTARLTAWTLGPTAPTQSVTASVARPGGSSLTLTFTAQASAPTPDEIAIIAPASNNRNLPRDSTYDVIVQVLSRGQPVANTRVTFGQNLSQSVSTSTFALEQTSTDAQGNARTTWKLGTKLGQYAATVQAGNVVATLVVTATLKANEGLVRGVAQVFTQDNLGNARLQAAPGSTVQFQQRGSVVTAIQTLLDGTFASEPLPAGKYTVIVSFPQSLGGGTATQYTEIRGGVAASLASALQRILPGPAMADTVAIDFASPAPAGVPVTLTLFPGSHAELAETLPTPTLRQQASTPAPGTTHLDVVLPNIARGVYTLQVTAPGYTTQYVDVVLTPPEGKPAQTTTAVRTPVTLRP